MRSDTVEKTYKREEAERDDRIGQRLIETIMNRARRVINLEASKGKRLSENVRSKYLLSPEEYFDKAYIRISYASIIRRYRQIRLQALVDAMCIVQKETNKDELIKKLRELIIEVGQAHKESKKQKGF